MIIGAFWAAGGLVLLYHWLTGHWFARVVVFAPMAVAFALLGFAYDNPTVLRLACSAIGVAIAWGVSGLPVYVWMLPWLFGRNPKVTVIPPEPWERRRIEPRLSAPTRRGPAY